MGKSFRDFYQGRRVLVTGHTGFKGGWLTTWLKLLRAEVVGYALPPETEPNLFTAAQIGAGITSIVGDVRDLASVLNAFREHKPEIVIHNAAQPLVRRSYREPVETYATNVMGTAHVLEAVRLTPSVRATVVVTSDKCYESQNLSRGYKESDCMGGHDPYSSSKGAAELVTAAYRRSFFSAAGSASVASARAGNVIGGGDWSEDRLVPDVVRAICASESVSIRNPAAVRPWQHVLDPLSGYLMLPQQLWEMGDKYAGPWNFGPREGNDTTVAEVARKTISAWGKGELKIESQHNAVHEAQYLRLNCEKAQQQIGWAPALNLDQAIDWTVAWYRAFLDKPGEVRAFTESQIERYMGIAAL